jgi:uncharacterized protein YktA (UPF0223 family)
MCFIRPLTVKKIDGNKIILDNKIEAFYEKKVGKIKVEDKVIVYGNLILEKVNEKQTPL